METVNSNPRAGTIFSTSEVIVRDADYKASGPWNEAGAGVKQDFREGDYLFPDLSNPTLQTVLAAMGAIVLLPLGIYFLVLAVKEPLRAYAIARQH